MAIRVYQGIWGHTWPWGHVSLYMTLKYSGMNMVTYESANGILLLLDILLQLPERAETPWYPSEVALLCQLQNEF